MNAWMLTALMPLMSAEGTMPPPPPSPILFIRFVAPDGTLITVRPGAPDSRSFASPTMAAFRPGYGYRLQLSQVPELPADATLSPSLEVLSTLHVPPGLKAEDYPATVQFTVDDIRRAAAGGMITKVVYLEDPFQAPAIQSGPLTPVELDVWPGRNPLEEARARGRPMAILRFGGREVPMQELAMTVIPGTVLALGDQGLPPPAAPPTLPRPLWQWYDPILGPKKPLEEILPDGGDTDLRVGIAPDGKMGNLNVTDTAAEFRYGTAPKRTTFSNRVCLFSPRFAILRTEVQPLAQDLIVGTTLANTAIGNLQLVNRVVTDTPIQVVAPRGMHVKVGVRGTQSRTGVAMVDRTIGVMVQGMVEGVIVEGGVVEVASATQINNCCRPGEPLILTKHADNKAPKPGDIVTFMLRYENVGAKPIRDIIIADSLASRFDYIPGSNQADRPAAFTIQTNEVWSAVLRWEIKGDLLPGQSGMVKFQARVR